MKSKSGRGRPTKYDPALRKRVNKYTQEMVEKGIFPTIEGLSVYLGVGTRTLYDWEKVYEDFSQTVEQLRDTQRELLITKGLNGGYNTRFAMFLLKAAHGMTEKDPLITSTQTNNFNVPPELLADALEIMRARREQR